MSSLFDEDKTKEARRREFSDGADAAKAFDAACRKLSLRMYTQKEIAEKLKKSGFEEAAIRTALAELKGYGYIDDEKYAREYFRCAKAKNKADARILRELAEKGIAQEKAKNIIEDMRAEMTEPLADERSLAEEVAQKLLRVQLADGKPIDERFFARVGRRLAGLGYDSGMIYGIIGRLRQDERNRQRESDEI